MTRNLILAVAAIATAYPCYAGQMTVGDLQQICTASDEGNKSACTGYILGVTEGMQLGAGVAGDNTHFCIPEGVPSSAMEFVVKKAIGEDLMFYQKDKDLAAAGFIGAAMMKQYPCKK